MIFRAILGSWHDFVSILKTRRLRHGEVNKLAQGRIAAGRWGCQGPYWLQSDSAISAEVSLHWTFLYLMSSPSPEAGIRGWWGEAGSPPPAPVRGHPLLLPPPEPGMQARGSLHPTPPSGPRCTSLFPLCDFTKLHLFDLSISSLFLSQLRDWDEGRGGIAIKPLESERWKCQGIYWYLSSLPLSSRHFLKMLLNFTLAFLLPFNLINRLNISSLYIWGERLSILNSLCPYESCEGALAVCIKPRLIEDRVKKIKKKLLIRGH